MSNASPIRRAVPAPSRPSTARKAAVALALLLTAENAFAGNILRRAGSASAAMSPDAAAAQAAAAQATAAAQAQAAMRQANAPLRRALEAIKEVQAAQDAARAAAAGMAGGVPNGLGAGGLEIAEGATWQGASGPAQTEEGGRTKVTITQGEEKAILSWTTFNVGKETDLRFDQSGGGEHATEWIALNRVLDPSAAPSKILGSLRAEGQVYVLNRNGVLFGGGSQVNVSTLVASGMDLAGGDARFLEGILAKPGAVTFGGAGLPAGAVTVEPGARIEIGPYGQALLLGGEVRNRGSISAPDGQVLLAAGDSVALVAASDSRGYAPPVVSGGGPVQNTGLVSARRGNITLVGSEVRQDGLLTATTGAEANGSIVLGMDGGTTTLGAGSRTQVLPDLPETADEQVEKVIGTGSYAPSKVAIYGKLIHLEGDSTVYAPSGGVTLDTAVGDSRPDDGRIYLAAGAVIDVSGLRGVEVPMERNTIEAQLRANELRDNPVMRDSPLRGRTVYFDARLGVDGVADLSGYYDLIERDVTELMVAGGSVALVGNELITREGSTIDLSGGSLRYLDGYVRSTTLIDVTGRRVRIEDAVAGQRYVAVDGEFVVDHARWGVAETYLSPFSPARPRFEQGYEQGADAGSLTLGTNGTTSGAQDAPAPDSTATGRYRIPDGTIVGELVVGRYQRDLPGVSASDLASQLTRAWHERPRGASLNLDKSGDVTIANLSGPQLDASFGVDGALDAFAPYEHVLPASWFDGETFGRVTISSGHTDDTSIQVPVPSENRAPGGHLVIAEGVTVNLGDGGSFIFTGKRADIDGALLAPGGVVSLTALHLPGIDPATGQPFPGETAADVPTVHLGSTGVIDVAGRFTNGAVDGAAPPRALNGGGVVLSARDVTLDEGSLVDVSGGGLVDAAGKLTRGNGGSIELNVTADPQPGSGGSREPYDGHLSMNGELAGYALGKGGSLSIAVPDELFIGSALPADAGEHARLVSPELFTEGGFSAFSLMGERGVTVLAGTVVAPSTETLVLRDAGAIPTGARLSALAPDVVGTELLPESLRRPMSLRLSTVPTRSVSTAGQQASYAPDVTLEAGATIRMDPASAVTLSALGTLRVDGTIDAPGGRIQLAADYKGLAANPLATPTVVVGSAAEVLAAGYLKETPDRELVRRSVEAGGSITITSPKEVILEEGSVLDVHGIAGTADLATGSQGEGRLTPVEVDGAAGTIAISASGGLVAGTLLLGPGGEKGAGGTLDLRANAAQMIVRQGAAQQPEAGRLTVVADRIDESGADDLVLGTADPKATNVTSSNAIVFDGDVSLETRRSITLVAPMLGTRLGGDAADVTLRSGYVRLDGGVATSPPASFSTDLAGTLTVEAGLIDLSRSIWLGCASALCRDDARVALGGFGSARFVSRGDLRLADYDAGLNTSPRPGLFSAGDLAFEAAQVYVASRFQSSTASLERAPADPGYLVLSDREITVARAQGIATPSAPLSFGERLTLRAPVIEQGGVLRAPQGQLRLEGSESVTLLPGSVTSASLEGAIVPYGAVLAGQEFDGYDAAGSAPAKEVKLSAPSVVVRGAEGGQPAAVIDVSGGGDLLGWRFSGGNGGSRDVLEGPNQYAIVPSHGTSPAPLARSQELLDAYVEPKVGDTVWLEGVPGLASGYYTLLPAYYARLPGGLLVTPLAGTFASAPETTLRPDGSVVAAGYRAVAGTAIRDPGFTRFQIMSADVYGKYSEYVSYSFSEHARAIAQEAGAAVRTPEDAGSAVLVATTGLVLDGEGRFGAADGALLGNLDVSAPKIAVVGAGASSPGEGYLLLEVDALSTFGAGSVLLGGTRAASSTGTAVTVSSSDVVVDTGAATPWVGPEILLAATDTVRVREGSVIEASGAGARDASTLQLGGNGALLRVSTGDRVGIVRTGASGASGVLDVGAATLRASGSLTLDGSASVALAPGADLFARQFDLASVRVNLGDAPVGTPGTTLGADALAGLASSSDLLLRAYDAIQVYGDLSLGARDPISGAPTIEKLTLDTGLLQGHLEAGQTTRISAGELTLRNSGPASTAPAEGGAGALALDVDLLALGPGQVKVAGLSAVQGGAGVIEGRGAGGLELGGALSLASGGLRAASGASTTLEVHGPLALTSSGGAAGPAIDAAGLGGRFSLFGSTVALDTDVILPSGTFEATAREGGLTLGANASVDVRGAAKDFQDEVRYAPGGAVRLAAAGDLTLASGSRLDVSASDRGGRAGEIALTAGGDAAVNGELFGSAAEGWLGGSFALDARMLGGFSELNGRLEAGGLDASRSIRLREQDLTLGAGETISAHDVVLRSDAGRVTVAGKIDAAGTAGEASGGRVTLVGGAGVALSGTAVIDARAEATPAGGFEPASGEVELEATGGRVDVAPGATVDVSGGRSGGGSVTVRAPRVGGDVAIDRLAGDFRARELVVQGSKDYQAPVVDAALASTLRGEAAAWLSTSEATIRGRLGLAGLPPLLVAPAMTVRSSGDLVIASDVSLGAALGAGHLAFEAPGRIDVRAVVSDGFASAARDAALASARSFSLSLESGGDLELHENAMIRTGTGDVSLSAGRDLVLDDATSAAGKPAVIYSAGLRTDPATGFAGAPRGAFPTNGGAVTLVAGRDILAPLPRQSVSAWLFRDGNTAWNGDAASSTVLEQASWSVVFKNFESGVGALGGGDVSVRAGRDVVQLEVSIPTTGHLTTATGETPSPGELVVRGGGDLDLAAGRDVLGGQFMLGRGHAELSAGGRFAQSVTQVPLRGSPGSTVLNSTRSVGALLGLMDATATLTAGSDVVVEAVFDPMRQGQIAEDLSAGLGTSFWGYTDRAAFDATSVSGSVTYRADPWASVDLSRRVGSNPAYANVMQGPSGMVNVGAWFQRAPPTLRLASLGSSVVLAAPWVTGSGSLFLAPAARGTLELLAEDDVRLQVAVTLDDIAGQYARGAFTPYATRKSSAFDLSTSGDLADGVDIAPGTNELRGLVPLHGGDAEPVRFYALEGSVCGYLSGSCRAAAGTAPSATITLPKPLALYAGQDVMAGNYSVQHNGRGDASSIRAARDVHEAKLDVAGVGVATIEAGRDFVLNFNGASADGAGGVVRAQGQGTVRPNLALPRDEGADVYVLAGTAGGLDLEGFAGAYLDPQNGQAVVRTYLPELGAYMEERGHGELQGGELRAAFDALPRAQRAAFLLGVYFTELKETGIDYNDPESARYQSYDRGFDAVARLFPGDPSKLAEGDVVLSSKVVETRANGDLTLVAPYGRIQIGAESLPRSVTEAERAKGGVVTRRGGDVRIMADGNVDLVDARVFTLQGGDITMWTSNGSITAGAGSKTSVFSVPLSYLISPDGVVTVNAFGIQTGSGIGVLDALQGEESEVKRSRLDLIAPRGEVNAGDAGIRVAGDLNIAAAVVVGMENIQVSGASAGVPTVSAPNVGALTSASQVAQAASKEGVGPEAQPRTAVADLPSIVTVEVVGYEKPAGTRDGEGEDEAQRKKRGQAPADAERR